jgi:hypothetical protein
MDAESAASVPALENLWEVLLAYLKAADICRSTSSAVRGNAVKR